MKIHELIKEQCKAKGIKPARAAKLAKVDPGGMSRFVNGQKKTGLSFAATMRLVKVLEINPFQLLELELD